MHSIRPIRLLERQCTQYELFEHAELALVSAGLCDVWADIVRIHCRKNYHCNRTMVMCQKHETEKASKQIRARSGKSFGILALTNSTQWVPKKAILVRYGRVYQRKCT